MTAGALNDQVWQSPVVIQRYLSGVRGGIPLAAEQLDVLLRVVRAGLGAPNRFLDLGCGDGILGRTLLGTWPEARGVFLDFTPAMLEACRNALASDVAEQTLVECDYGQPDWVNTVQSLAPFDAIVSGFSIHHQEDDRKRTLYGELFELLRPGGVFLNLEHVASASSWGEHIFDDHFTDALVRFHQCQGSSRSAEEVTAEYYRRPDKAANRLAPVENQCQWLRDSGFERVDCFFKVFELALFGGLRPA